MKTTIKLSKTRSFTVQPSGRGVQLEFRVHGVVLFCDVMDADAAGALIFGMEQALEAGQIAGERDSEKRSSRGVQTPFPVLGGCDDGSGCNQDCSQGRECPERRVDVLRAA